MKLYSLLRPLALIASALLVPACTWVNIPDDAREVTLAETSAVGNCKRLGSVTTTVAWKVAGIERGENRIRVELDNLARERALGLGGNTVVRESIRQGTGQYSAYKCP